jgi:hypothetical protein
MHAENPLSIDEPLWMGGKVPGIEHLLVLSKDSTDDYLFRFMILLLLFTELW